VQDFKIARVKSQPSRNQNRSGRDHTDKYSKPLAISHKRVPDVVEDKVVLAGPLLRHEVELKAPCIISMRSKSTQYHHSCIVFVNVSSRGVHHDSQLMATRTTHSTI
jgi:hypothetical protein